MNLTLSIDRQVLDRAREVARAQGKSVNQLIREDLEQLAVADDLEHTVEELQRTGGTGRRSGWRFNRNELHERT